MEIFSLGLSKKMHDVLEAGSVSVFKYKKRIPTLWNLVNKNTLEKV